MVATHSATPEDSRTVPDRIHHKKGGTLILDRQFRSVGRIKRASGTKNKELLKEINNALTELAQMGDTDTLCALRDGQIMPIHLLYHIRLHGWSAPVPRHARARSQVYALRAVPSGNIKIGVTRNVDRRIDELSASHFEEITLLVAVPGTLNHEQFLHRTLQEHRIRGEWYRPTEAVLHVIELMKAHNKVPR